MDVTKIRLNPVNNTRQYDLPGESKRRLRAVQGLLKQWGIRVLLLEKGVDVNDRWLNDTVFIGPLRGGLTIVPDEGTQLVVNGYRVIPEGPANRLTGGQGYCTDDCCYLHGMGYTMGEAPVKADHSAHRGSSWSEHIPMQVNMQTLAHPHVGYAGNQFTGRDDMVRCIDTYYVVHGGSVRATTASREITML